MLSVDAFVLTVFIAFVLAFFVEIVQVLTLWRISRCLFSHFLNLALRVQWAASCLHPSNIFNLSRTLSVLWKGAKSWLIHVVLVLQTTLLWLLPWPFFCRLVLCRDFDFILSLFTSVEDGCGIGEVFYFTVISVWNKVVRDLVATEMCAIYLHSHLILKPLCQVKEGWNGCLDGVHTSLAAGSLAKMWETCEPPQFCLSIIPTNARTLRVNCHHSWCFGHPLTLWWVVGQVGGGLHGGTVWVPAVAVGVNN